jgi:hypothetical protein
VLYLAEPIDSDGSATTRELQSLVPLLVRGDVLLSEGNTRLAALVKRVTRSSWSHVSMYVGPLEEASDPRCVVEADIAGGVRAIRLSELNALHLRVLRPTGVADMPRHQAADWVVSRIGCEYDLALALALCREMLQVPLLRRWSMSSAVANSASRFICCSLLANAFALVGYPIFPVQSRISPMAAADQTHLTPGDFERASVFEVVCGFPPTGS